VLLVSDNFSIVCHAWFHYQRKVNRSRNLSSRTCSPMQAAAAHDRSRGQGAFFNSNGRESVAAFVTAWPIRWYGDLYHFYLCMCVCPRCTRKTTWAINTKLVHIYSLGRILACADYRSQGQRVMKSAAGVGMHHACRYDCLGFLFTLHYFAVSSLKSQLCCKTPWLKRQNHQTAKKHEYTKKTIELCWLNCIYNMGVVRINNVFG